MTAKTVAITRLPNGLSIATDHIESVQSVCAGVWFKVGSRHEQATENGVAHLIEHMAFKGTARRNAYDIVREAEDVGGFLNAYTSREVTAYYGRFLAEHMPLAMDLLSDIVLNPRFEAEELERERNVILQELGQALDTPDDIIFDHFQEAAYPNQGAGQPVLGRAEVIENLDLSELIAFRDQWYDPAMMTVCASGKVSHDQLVALAEEAFGHLQPKQSANPSKAFYTGGQFHETRQDLEQVHLVLGYPASSFMDESYYTGSVLATLLGGGMSSRLFQEVREKRGLVYGIQAFLSSMADAGLFSIYAGTGAEQVEELLPLLHQCLADVSKQIDNDEIERAKAQHLASLMMARESTTARCEALSQAALWGLPTTDPDVIASKVSAVTRSDLIDYAGELLTQNPTLATIGPIAAPSMV